MDPMLNFYPESRFGGFTDVDQVIVFYTRVRALLESSSTVLDIGCGRGAYADDPIPMRRDIRSLRGTCRKLIGIDVNGAAQANPFVDEFYLISSGEPWPIEDASIDLAICDFVLEHVEFPEAFFSECRRVLKPGGYLCMRTTNALSYFGLAARLIPTIAHAAVIQKIYARPRKKEDVFPTRYRCNTVRVVRRMLDRHGFKHCVYGYQADPAHFSFSPLLYFFGVLHQRYAPRFVRPAIFVFARKR